MDLIYMRVTIQENNGKMWTTALPSRSFSYLA
ncbi:hypothetical protein LEMLEM_LOCUS26259, partial [Lemmus lemmus]